MDPDNNAKLRKTGLRWGLASLFFLLVVIFVAWLITAGSIDLSKLSGAAGAQETMIAEELSATPATPVPATATPAKTPTPTPTKTADPIGFDSQSKQLTGPTRGEKIQADNWMSLLGITGSIGAIIALIAVWRAVSLSQPARR